MADIDYGKIIKRSWEVTKNNRWLWVVGLALATFSGSSSYRGSSSSGSRTNYTPGTNPTPVPNNLQSISEKTSNILGAATSAIENWFKSIPPHYWIIFVLGLTVFIIFAITLRWVITSWAKGALISGFEDADAGHAVNLKTMTPQGLAKIKDLIIYGFVSFGVSAAFVLGYILILGLGFLFKAFVPALGNIWLVLFGAAGALALIVFMIIFAMLGVYSERLIVLKNYKPWDAWKKAFKITKGNFLPTAIMGIINITIGCVSGCASLLLLLLIFAIPGYLLIAPLFINGFHWPNISQAIGILVLLMLFGSMNFFVKGILTVFDYGNWNLLFRQILENEKQ